MTTTYTVLTEPSTRVPATGTLPALRTIVLHRNGPPLDPSAAPAPAPAPPRREGAAPAAVWVPPRPAALQELRLRTGLSQRKAAALGRISRGLVSELECGSRSVGKGVTTDTLRPYVTMLQKAAADAQ
jgi:hypothetical protein